MPIDECPKVVAFLSMTHAVQAKWRHRTDGWYTIACFDVLEAADEYAKLGMTRIDPEYRVVTLT